MGFDREFLESVALGAGAMVVVLVILVHAVPRMFWRVSDGGAWSQWKRRP